MKKLLIFTSIVLFGFSTVYAQDINFGAKAGVNFASITGDDTDWVDSRTSLHIGVVAEIVISETFSFQPELLYSAQGGSYKESEGYDGTLKFDYLNVPLMAKFYVGEGFSLEAGPQIGLLLSAKDDWEFISNGETGNDDWKDFMKGIDFGVNVGVGYKLEGGLNFGARYNLGLSNIWEDSGDIKSQNSVIQAYVGFFF